MLTKKKQDKNTIHSFEARLNAAHATAAAATSVVDKIADDLETAAAEKRGVVHDIDGQIAELSATIDHLYELRDEALVFEDVHLVKAEKIRALVSA